MNKMPVCVRYSRAGLAMCNQVTCNENNVVCALGIQTRNRWSLRSESAERLRGAAARSGAGFVDCSIDCLSSGLALLEQQMLNPPGEVRQG